MRRIINTESKLFGKTRSDEVLPDKPELLNITQINLTVIMETAI